MDTSVLNKFGKRLRVLRDEKGMSQEELGFKSKIHRTYIGAVERGEQNISLKSIEKLAKGLGVKLKDLFSF